MPARLSGRFARARRRRDLAEARALVPRILAGDPAARAVCGPECAVERAELTSTGVAVVMVSTSREQARAVFKLAMTPQSADGMLRESQVLAELHADGRLGDWRGLVPVSRASGTVAGCRYRVDTALKGQVMLDRLGEQRSRVRLVESAAEAIHVLHRASATVVAGDDRLAERWIDTCIADLLVHDGAHGLESRLHELGEELRGALDGRTFSAGWIHGDYWLGNLLFDASTSRPRGIVDWDAAAPADLPVIDLLHLILYTRRLTSGRDLGEIVREYLRGADWPPDERRLLDRFGDWCHEGSLSARELLLLYWLRHVALHARQQGQGGGLVYRRWRNRNVRNVLESL